MKVNVQNNALSDLKADLLVLMTSMEQAEAQIEKWAQKFGKNVAQTARDFTGKKGQQFLVYPNKKTAKRLLLLGLGEEDKTADMEVLRQSIAATLSTVRQVKATKVGIVLPDLALPRPDLAQALVEGFYLAAYQFNRYRTQTDTLASDVEQLTLWTKEGAKAVRQGAERGQIIAAAVCRARDLVNLSPNEKTPLQLATYAQEDAEAHGFEIEVWDKARIEAEGFGGLLAVNLGSLAPPSFSIMTWKPENIVNEKPIVLVGKGVVFDTGGLSLKPTKDSMDHMKCDMAGAAAVIATMQAITRLQLPLHVIALVPSTDNRPGENAYVPGDVIRMHNGLTVEVLNTDAEGRMILADALSYAQRYEPELVIDLATLTGAQVVALGNFVAGLMTNEDTGSAARLSAMTEAGKRAGDWVHPLPMFGEFGELLKSTVADLKNIGGPMAGTITAGKFLERFTTYPWMHVDIAGPAWLGAARHYQPVGGTGFGVKLLVEFLTARATTGTKKDVEA